MKKILIVGGGGQIGTELVGHLRQRYGDSNVVSSDIHGDPDTNGHLKLDALDAQGLAEVVKTYKVDAIYNLVALLSARGEANPLQAWQINMGALLNILEVSRQYGCSTFTPSSIGAFGPDAPKMNTPQETAMHPTTIYGVCKVAGEMLGDYYYARFGVDARSVRLPGAISSVAAPGGGTTDYAVEIFYDAVAGRPFTCPVPHDRLMDMMYMPDVLRAMTELMEAPSAKLIRRNGYNVGAMSFSPEMLCAEIQKHLPDFRMSYQIDPLKDAISAGWPDKMDDSVARREWGWKAEWDLPAMTADMIRALRARL